jgi:hypothetical protein
MVIRYITIRNFGSVRAYHTALNPKFNLIDTHFIPELSAAFELLLCSKVRQEIPTVWVRENTRITAGILLNNTMYTANVTPDKDRLQLAVTDPSGLDVTDDYRHTLSHCPEQDATECFDGQDKTLLLRLCWYRNREADEIPGDLSDRTKHIADTKTFRSHLIRYIKAFQPEPINCKKNYQATINEQGKFEVIYPGVSGKVFLSETEEKLFLYICFLNIAEFWECFEKIRDLHHEKKPLLIQNFLEFLDESTDISSLITRTLRIKRQVILLTLPLNEEIKKKWIGKCNE